MKQCDDQIAALRAQLDAGRKEIETLRAPYANDPEFQKYEAYRDDGIDLARLEYNEMRRLSRDMENLKELREQGASKPIPKWLELDADKLTGKVVAMPQRDDIDLTVEEHLIVEFYSR